MTSSSERDPARARLAELMDERRRHLRLTWDQVASRAGIHRETLRQIRGGSGNIRPLSATGIEDALDWARGSIDAILAGGRPSPAGAEPQPAEAPTGEGDDELTDDELELVERIRRDPAKRRRLLDAILAGHGHEIQATETDNRKRGGHKAS